jgi:hypothetical protein
MRAMTMTDQDARKAQRQRNVRLGLILASIALTFFAGFVVKTMLFPAG